ncbi:RidA family protein [Candidatus Micrarchaeota archaeon]|nr:RidA family protein [Candidatus Micrarchaeota archaeon]
MAVSSISSDKAPKAIGPYSQAVKVQVGGEEASFLIFCSGQIGLMQDGQMVPGGIRDQTKQVLANLKEVLEAAGSSKEKVVKTTVYLKDMNEFSQMNDEYARFFGEHKPARATIQAAKLPKDALIEIECVATAEE